MLPTLSCPQVALLLEQKAIHLLDVREPEEYQEVAIPGALLLPLAQLSWAALPREWTDASDRLPIVIHCRSGKRSALACHRLLSESSDATIYNLEGGIMAWMEQGFEVYSPPS